jgi:two-component system cell cycle response regulator
MIRVLLIEDDLPAAELTVRLLESTGFDCACERVASEAEFREALSRAPHLVLSDSGVPGFDGLSALAITRAERPGTPFIFVSGSVDADAARVAMEHGAAGYVHKSDMNSLAPTVRVALGREAQPAQHGRDQRRRSASASGTAAYLLERRDVLDRTLRDEDRSIMSGTIRGTPPIPAALVMIECRSTHDRFVKLLRNANIELDEAESSAEALARLEDRIHALMFTDRLDLIRAARQGHVGAATHIVYITRDGATSSSEALRAGANDCMPDEPGGEEFWAHLTTARRIASLAASLQLALTDNRILSTIDELTRVGSRRFFEHQFPREVERAVRLGHPLSLLMCDLDHFKSINDTHGHQAGDEVLREFADRLTHGLRLGEDWVARIGGEEFALVLPETGRTEAVAVAQRLCERTSGSPFVVGSQSLAITASFGVCGVQGVQGRASGVADEMVRAADIALYESKNGGRNRVTSATYPAIQPVVPIRPAPAAQAVPTPPAQPSNPSASRQI